MKTILLFLSMLSLNFSDNFNTDLHGVWQEATANEFVRIGINGEFETVFQRILDRKMVAYGTIETSSGIIHVNNEVSKSEYDLMYAFSPSGNTVVISKPNSNEAWVFHRVGN